MYTFYEQPKYAVSGLDNPPIGYELFIRQWNNNGWQLPKDFNAITSQTLRDLLYETIESMPNNVIMLSFNLEQSQFIDLKFLQMVADVQSRTDIKIFTELTERIAPGVTNQELIDAGRRFHEAGLYVCIDDVGTGQNTPGLVLGMNDYINEYKFAFQNFRPFNDINEIKQKLDFWYNLAQEKGKLLAIEGLEDQKELETVKEKYPCFVVQGYLMGKPQRVEQGE